MTPLFSVVIPTRNRAALLPRAIESVRRQSVAAWELLVVDDASDDDTPSVLAEFAAREPRLRALRMDCPRGAPAARNRAVSMARGRWIAFLDDDDEWLPGKLERQQAALITADELALAYGPILTSHGPAGDVDIERRDGLRLLLHGNVLSHSTVVVSREAVVQAGGFDERLPRLQDWDLWLRLARDVRFRYVAAPLARIHDTPGSISTRPELLVEACRLLSAKLPALAPDRASLADGYAALAYLVLRAGAASPGRGYLMQALRVRPWPPRRFAHALLAAAGAGVYRAATDAHARHMGARRAETAR